jgi:hypothetical protein
MLVPCLLNGRVRQAFEQPFGHNGSGAGLLVSKTAKKSWICCIGDADGIASLSWGSMLVEDEE